ncbi:MAG: T9SS type A sorting domain-containing protein [candidate division WOR-3 bacterium]|nr:MAG: T9SS type A sorting domain-containing protein [candidate division WOR-3 bacterium]
MNVIVSMVSLTCFLYSNGRDEIPLLRWAGPEGSCPGTYEEWVAQHPYSDFSYIIDDIVYGDGRAGIVAILTDQTLATSLAFEIDQLIDNLQFEGYTVLSYQISGGEPETLRSFLQDLYATGNIEGAFFIGDLPVPWFEIADDFNTYGYAQFPIDLFYMDVNGTWLDTMNTGNGKYDGHIGDVNPEIYIGRLTPQGLGDDTLLIKNYFSKNNAYRLGSLRLRERALVFVDDDWIPWAPQWAADVALLYTDTMNYWDPETTRASVYRVKLDTTQAWVAVFAHSWPGGHSFTYNSGTNHDYYYSTEYTNQNPPTNFYNFFACSFCRYTESGNCGGNRAIFNQTSGVGAIGSTKTGSMLDFHYFYRALNRQEENGNTLGEAFKYWFDCIYDSVGMDFNRLCWHYGMTLLADPFLKPIGHVVGVEEVPYDAAISPLTVLGNPVSTTLLLQLSLSEAENVTISLYDCSGRKVTQLMNNGIAAGQHIINLQCTDQTGNQLPNGVYIMLVQTDSETITRKIVKIQ